jgi:hypothetical protein
VDVETVVGVIPQAKRKTGLFSSTTYALVVTDRRLLLAEQTGDVSRRQAAEAKASAQAAGKGFVGQWAASTGSGLDRGRHYFEMDPAAILAEAPGNSAVVPGEVREIKVDRKVTSDDDGTIESSLKITIRTARGDSTYTSPDEKVSRDEVRALLAGVFGPAVR